MNNSHFNKLQVKEVTYYLEVVPVQKVIKNLK
jgi:hypothetical protein